MPIRSLLRSLLGRDRVPADVLAGLGLEPGERALTWAPLAPSGSAVATDRALLLADRAGGGQERVPWWQVLGATWDSETSRLALEVLEAGRPRARRVALAAESLLPEAVRERVQSSIVVSRHVRLGNRGAVRLVARRVPGRDDPLWQEVYDPAVDAADPEVRRQVAAALQELRAQTL